MNSVIPLAGAHILVAAAWPHLSPRSIYRPIIVAVVAVCCAISFNSIDMNTWWGTEVAEYALGFAMYVNYFLCLRKLVFVKASTPLQTFKAPCGMLFNSRCEIPAKELPAFSARDSEYFPSRKAFLLTRIRTFAWTTGAFAIVHNIPLNFWTDDFQSPKDQLLRRLPEVSAREWTILFHCTISLYLMPYCLFTAAHSLVSVVAVAFGDAPMHWRPLFGDLREAYTVQRFFGIFWHKLMRKAFTGHASLLVYDVLGMPRRAPHSRAAIIFVAFLISGVMHSLTTPLPLRCAAPLTMLYYCGVGATVVLEYSLQSLFKRYFTNKTGLVGDSPMLRVLGYLWVLFFHLWTTAKSTYPLTSCSFNLGTESSTN
ncbi:hypothetical protein MMC07_003054 [Pseudocyphellaria aurata]|nr:hypothetical protein [Pseudocyphellaria aurata]